MKANSKTVIEVLAQVANPRVRRMDRTRGLKPSAVRFAFDEKLVAEYRQTGVILTDAGRAALCAAKPEQCQATP